MQNQMERNQGGDDDNRNHFERRGNFNNSRGGGFRNNGRGNSRGGFRGGSRDRSQGERRSFGGNSRERSFDNNENRVSMDIQGGVNHINFVATKKFQRRINPTRKQEDPEVQ